MVVAVLLRMVAVIFAKGWGMIDDHFLVIEVAQSWLDGGTKSHWLPGYPENEGPTGHTFFYAGLHFVFFWFLELLGIFNPQTKMFFVRLIHAAFSLLIVYYGYRIADKMSDKNAARLTGLLLAAYWFMPWLGVRNLVEVVAIPFLLVATWMLMQEDRKYTWFRLLLAGFIAGVAFSVRYQSMIYAGGMGLALLFDRRIREALLFGTGYLISMMLIQGITDLIIWGYPFAEFIEYVRYNIAHRNDYISGGWYHYIVFLLGMLIPPVSIFMLSGMFKNWRRRLLLFLPAIIFLVFHSYFPNKQERFILTIVPLIIILGTIGWHEIYHQSLRLKKYRNLIRGSWIFFWIVNIVLLAGVSTMYSKRARAEAMTYLSRYDNVHSILLENTNGYGIQIVPQFYLGQWVMIWEYVEDTPTAYLDDMISKPEHAPRFVLFYRDENLDDRVENLRKYLPGLVFEKKIEPGTVDKIMHWINPHNKNQTIFIYRNKSAISRKSASDH